MKSVLAERGLLRQVPLPSATDALLTLIQPVDAARGADVHGTAQLGFVKQASYALSSSVVPPTSTMPFHRRSQALEPLIPNRLRSRPF
jgi:hypothetical protein